MKKQWSRETLYSYPKQSIKIELNLDCGREITEDEDYIISKKIEDISNELRENTVKTDPEHIKMLSEERENILDCFPQTIWVKELLNPYYPDGYRPAYLVTTTRGPIQIHWRKRVLEINWSQSDIKATAEDLFADQDVTKDKHMIHAYGYDMATKYIKILLNTN